MAHHRGAQPYPAIGAIHQTKRFRASPRALRNSRRSPRYPFATPPRHRPDEAPLKRSTACPNRAANGTREAARGEMRVRCRTTGTRLRPQPDTRPRQRARQRADGTGGLASGDRRPGGLESTHRTATAADRSCGSGPSPGGRSDRFVAAPGGGPQGRSRPPVTDRARRGHLRRPGRTGATSQAVRVRCRRLRGVGRRRCSTRRHRGPGRR
jgi:hypothetical protein